MSVMRVFADRGRARLRAYLTLLLLVGAGSAQDVSAQTIEYYVLDATGSVRAVTNQAGTLVRRHDYLPFGEEPSPQAGADDRRLTRKERDAESGLDYFGARYYSSRTGRFTTFDPVVPVQAALQNRSSGTGMRMG